MSNKIIALESEIMQAELKMDSISKENFDYKKKLADLTVKLYAVLHLLINLIGKRMKMS